MKIEVSLPIRVFNILIRTITIVARFVLIILLTKFLTVSEVADYGIFTAILAYLLYLIGLDFYIFSHREIITLGLPKAGKIIKLQLFVNLFMFVICSLCFYLFNFLLNWNLIINLLFVPLLLLEYLNQEIARFLIVLGRPVLSTLLTFIRQALWVLFIAALFYFHPDLAKLELALSAWLMSGILALLLGIKPIIDFNIGGWSEVVSIKLLKRGVAISTFMLCGTLALRGVQTFDRLTIESFNDEIFLASYVLAFGIASILPVLIDSGLLVFSYPRLIEVARNGDFEQVIRIERNLFSSIFVVVIFFSIFSMFSIAPFLNLLGKPEYMQSLEIFPYLLLAFVIYSLGLTSHYALYARGLDSSLVSSQFCGLIVFVMVTLLLSGSLGPRAVLWGMLISFSSITCIKIGIHFLYVRKNQKILYGD